MNTEIAKKSKELGPVQQEVLDHFNLVTGRKFQKVKGLATLLKAGYTLDDVKTVIEYQAQEWMGDKKMHQYLRPETLFRQSNFEGYLNNARQRVNEIVPVGPKSTRDMTIEEHFDTSWADGL